MIEFGMMNIQNISKMKNFDLGYIFNSKSILPQRASFSRAGTQITITLCKHIPLDKITHMEIGHVDAATVCVHVSSHHRKEMVDFQIRHASNPEYN